MFEAFTDIFGGHDGDRWAARMGSAGLNVKCKNQQQLAAWFKGFADACFKARIGNL